MVKRSFISIIFILLSLSAFCQVKIRLFAGINPGFVLFNVSAGEYIIDNFNGDNITINPDDLVMLTRYNGKVLIKKMSSSAIVCDSLKFTGKTGNDSFTLRNDNNLTTFQKYSGELFCKADLGTMLLINSIDIEQYIAGVVRSEGGTGKNAEYIKSQALITRTYMHKYMDKHLPDGYNLCDNTHCQVFQGITDDSTIINSVFSTKGEIIIGQDSLPIIAAFHSNCGGETSPSEYVWLTAQPYLSRVTDPFCRESRNATWKKTVHIDEWTGLMKKEGMTELNSDNSVFNFNQFTRASDYVAGNFRIPLRKIREDNDLRSTFFSVTVDGDSVIINGKGYGHGVGLCQEGAMVMAAKGFTYKQIVGFYYSGVSIIKVDE